MKIMIGQLAYVYIHNSNFFVNIISRRWLLTLTHVNVLCNKQTTEHNNKFGKIQLTTSLTFEIIFEDCDAYKESKQIFQTITEKPLIS